MIYYVDNISGASSNDGLTPETAVILDAKGRIV